MNKYKVFELTPSGRPRATTGVQIPNMKSSSTFYDKGTFQEMHKVLNSNLPSSIKERLYAELLNRHLDKEGQYNSSSHERFNNQLSLTNKYIPSVLQSEYGDDLSDFDQNDIELVTSRLDSLPESLLPSAGRRQSRLISEDAGYSTPGPSHRYEQASMPDIDLPFDEIESVRYINELQPRKYENMDQLLDSLADLGKARFSKDKLELKYRNKWQSFKDLTKEQLAANATNPNLGRFRGATALGTILEETDISPSKSAPFITNKKLQSQIKKARENKQKSWPSPRKGSPYKKQRGRGLTGSLAWIPYEILKSMR